MTAPNDQTNSEGDNVSLQLQGTASSGSLTYSASGLPDGLSLNTTTGLISGTIAAGAAANGPFTVDVSASNGNVSTSQTFTWTVNPVVNLTAPADQNNNEGDPVSLQMTATDSLNKALTYSATGLLTGLNINSITGLISGSITSGDPQGGPFAVTVTASDGTYSSSVTFNWAVTDKSALTLSNPGTQTNVSADSVSVSVHGSDPDGDAVTYSATNLPDGLDIDPSSAIISGTIAEDAADPTPYQVVVTATDGNGQSVSQTFTWIVNAPTLTAQGAPINAVEGVDPSSLTIATFTTPDLNSLADDFMATIDWGDATTDTGAITGSNGSFTVTDDHVYAEPGTYVVTVQLADSQTGGSTTVVTTAKVTDAPLTVTGGFDLGVVQQQSPTLTLATFTDANANATSADYTATINWGDGSGNVAATVVDSGDGVFSVVGSHPYQQNGVYSATITVTDVDGATATATSTVTVGNLIAGIPSTLTVATFQDSNPNVQASQLTATIQWGDGTQSSGTVVGGTGTFSVQATHTYAVDSLDNSGGVYNVTVTIQDPSSDTLTGGGSVTVVRPQLTETVANLDIAASLTVSNAPVAMFTDPNVSDGTSEFTAQINWGDGTPVDSGAVIQEVSPGLFRVLGSHTYASYDWYTMTVTVSQGWQQQKADVSKPTKNGGKAEIQFWVFNSEAMTHEPTETLRISRWVGAFQWTGSTMRLRRNFVNYIYGNFRVRVKDDAVKTDTIKVTLNTSSDKGHQIQLTKNKNSADEDFGWFVSPYLVLTTFAADQTAAGSQAFNAKLGDTVTAIYNKKEVQAKVPVKKVVKLHINILNTEKDAKPATTKAKVESDFADANMIYASTGILFKIDGEIKMVNPPKDIKLGNGLDSYLDPNWNGEGKIPMTDDEKTLLGDATLRAQNDINVYYVNALKSETVASIEGEAFWAAQVPDANYADSVIISAEEANYITLAHEIGHVLLDDGDHPKANGNEGVNRVNLMYLPDASWKGIFSTRRIFRDQAENMLTTRRPLLSPP